MQSSKKRICMLAYTQYECDNRVRRYAEALLDRGDQVDVIAIGGKEDKLGMEKIAGVSVWRIQKRSRDERGKWDYVWRLMKFVFVSALFLFYRSLRSKYDLIHVHNMPDFLIFAAIFPKIIGTHLILDIHDVVPELFMSKFGARADGKYVRLLKYIERGAAFFADHVIVSNHLWYEKIVRRSVIEDKCSVFVNYVDPAIFYQRKRTRNDERFIILFPGSFQWHQGLDIAIEAFAKIENVAPRAEMHFYGEGRMEKELISLTKSLHLNGRVKFYSSMPIDKIADVMANADLGIVPKRADSFGNEAYSTKILEFMSQGVPVVVSRTRIDMHYFNDGAVLFFPSGDAQSLAEAILAIMNNKKLREGIIREGYRCVEKYGWNRKRIDYLRLIDGLIDRELHKEAKQKVVGKMQ
jgi:glycosyltransferase involved in cell wall biosynthesis